MKKTLFLLLFIVAGLTILFNNSFGQSPQLINYQAVAHNASGQLLENQNISVRISILSGSATGTTEYSETHAVTTNQFGIFTIQIGGGSIISGTFTAISWASAPHFVKVEADETGGSNYQLVGTSQLVAVPYSLYSENAGRAVNDQDTSNTNELQTLSINSYDLSISNGNSVTLPTGFSGNYNDLSNKPDLSGFAPAGSILPYAGTTAPTGYLLCDGSAISRTTYASLFTTMGTAYGSGDGTTTFNLPDFRGRFLRGIDGTAGNDPDNVTRTESNTGGNTGNNIGSLQDDATKLPNNSFTTDTYSHSHSIGNYSHSHTLGFATIGQFGGYYELQTLNGNTSSKSTSSDTHSHTCGNDSHNHNIIGGDSETRPKNVYVNYIIKY